MHQRFKSKKKKGKMKANAVEASSSDEVDELLRTDSHGNPIQNWDVAGPPEGDTNVP